MESLKYYPIYITLNDWVSTRILKILNSILLIFAGKVSHEL